MTTTQPPVLAQRDRARTFDDGAFDEVYGRVVAGGPFQEDTDYYRYYQSRYRHVLRSYAAYLVTGKELWQPFARTRGDHFMGMFLDFSCGHLVWQLETAGYRDIAVELVEHPQQATTRMGRPGNLAGRPFTRVARSRSGIVAVATA